MARQFNLVWWFAAVCFLTSSASAQFVSGSDGSDGAFNPLVSTEVDLSLAAPASWDAASPVAGQGVYDSAQWAVVFKYTTIDIPAGVTVTFKNHPSGAPVVWLTTGNVTISGIVNLNGQRGHTNEEPFSYAQPGPGGFAGGVGGVNSFLPSGGFGPGGGPVPTLGRGGSGSYATLGSTGSGVAPGSTYGNISVTPLIGGSGGAGGTLGTNTSGNGGGGGGGGAILIASSTEILLVPPSPSGVIFTDGGQLAEGTQGSSGSGGAIRLLANKISGDGGLLAVGRTSGATNGHGRIRVESPDLVELASFSLPVLTMSSTVGPVFPPATAPILRVTQVASASVGVDPAGNILSTDLQIDNSGAVTIAIEATDIPAGTTVEVRVVPARGLVVTATSTPLVGTGVLTATADLTLPTGRSVIQLRANWTP